MKIKIIFLSIFFAIKCLYSLGQEAEEYLHKSKFIKKSTFNSDYFTINVSQRDYYITWQEPDSPEKHNSKLTAMVTSDSIYNFKGTVAPYPTAKKIKFSLYRDEKRVIDDDKLGNTKTANHDIFKKPFSLLQGIHVYKIGLQLDNQPIIFSTSIYIDYRPLGKPNLYLYSIGVSTNLDFTKNDADDIDSIFATQKNIYGAIERVKLTQKEQTTTKEIEKKFELLEQNSSEIFEKDVMIIFISSHGNTFKSSYRLTCSDSEDTNPGATTLDFERVMREYIKNLKCKKIFIIDACKSGALGGRNTFSHISDFIKNTPEGTYFILSSQQGQSSYEDSQWQNGAFTKAIIEGLSGKADTKRWDLSEKRLIKGKDNVIFFTELQEYLEIRVPQLVQQKYGGNIKQNPKIQFDNAVDFPIFTITN